MSKFSDIKGYKDIKTELAQICDMMRNPEIYAQLGARLPQGLLLYGEPGVGKTLMANALIEESGWKAYVCRKDRPSDDFINHIKETFETAKANAPSIVFLDDMDKYANEDENHENAEEFITIQSCIDDLKDCDVFVLATANGVDTLPDSLYRLGRFDRTRQVQIPSGKDAAEIVAYYLKDKACVGDLDPKEIARLLDRCSCADLETVINEAGVYAGFERAEHITMEHIIRAYLSCLHGLPASGGCSCEEALWEVAYHEAGHVAAAEALVPGSVTLATVRGYDRFGKGMVLTYLGDAGLLPLKEYRYKIITGLAGRAATELRTGVADTGAISDLLNVYSDLYKLVVDMGIFGIDRGDFLSYHESSDYQKAKQESAISAEAEKCYQKAKRILANSKDFVEALAKELKEKKTLSHTEIRAIRDACGIVPAEL